MALTPAQKLTLRTHIQANTTSLAFGGGSATIADTFNAASLGSGDAAIIADWYNATASPDFYIWRDLPMDTVLKLVTMANMTPVDAVPTDTALNVAIWQARALACQGKQFNFQNITISRTTAPMKTTAYRAALQDCLTNIPAGASGANIAANWTGVRDAAKFLARNLEKVFATGTGSQATPADATFEGIVTGDEISDIKGLPA